MNPLQREQSREPKRLFGADLQALETGRKLKLVREQLRLRHRDVEEASIQISARHGKDEYILQLSRLADIENRGTVPSIFRLYSICVIYRLDPVEVLAWYGVELGELSADQAAILRSAEISDSSIKPIPEPSAPAMPALTESGHVPDDELSAVLRRVEDVVGDSDAALRWMGTPVRELNYATPISQMGSAEGVDAVQQLLGRLEYGVL